MKKKWLALLLASLWPVNSPGLIPVEDYAALPHIIETDLKSVAAYAQQVQQYQTQLLQYKNMLLNTTGIAQAAQIWQQAQATMRQVTGVISIFQNGSSLQNILSQFQQPNYWLNTPVTSYPNQAAGGQTQWQANQNVFQGLAQQTQQMRIDAATLERLQQSAGSASGQMQAITAGSQLSAQINAQLLQIRALLVQEQQSLAAQNAASANTDAMRQAATTQYYGTQLAPESQQGW